MRQVFGTFTKTIKCFTRIRAIPIFTIVLPMFLLLITGVSLNTSVSTSDLPIAKGVLTISMVAFSLMTAGILNLAGTISRDRETGLLTKLKSMPISPWRDFLGRIMASALLSLAATSLIVAVGLAFGARFSGTMASYIEVIGFLVFAIISSAGIGLIIGSYTKLVLATFLTGLGITLVTAFISGIFITYEALPQFLRAFSRFYPISSATSSSVYLLLGESAAGYNPLTTGQVISTVLISIGFLALGVIIYTKQAWKRD
ncbi:MAG: ABC transporter permease [Dehalococcoidales bacterium]